MIEKIIGICSFFILFVLVYGRYGKKIKMAWYTVWSNRTMLFALSKNDFKVKYAGSYFGIVWGFIQPFITIGVYWFVFQGGFRSGSVVEGYPFILWLMCGIIPWFFFVEAVSSGTNGLLDYHYLVKKVVFPVDILPSIRLVSTYYVHIFFMFFMLLAFFLYGIFPDVHWLQVVYCEVCLFVLLAGIVYACSAVIVFFKDLSQMITIGLQIGLWVTPILWDYSSVSANGTLLFVLKLNPIFYIVQQYRNTFLYQRWFWTDWKWTIYFWGITLFLFGVGTILFQKLKIHFADVL